MSRSARSAAPLGVLALLLAVSAVFAQSVVQDALPGLPRGPYHRLLLPSVMVIDGTGGAPVGPVDLLIEGNQIGVATRAGSTDPHSVDQVLDCAGCYVLPGFVDMHAHVAEVTWRVPVEYQYELWLAHGITTIRQVGGQVAAWSMRQKRLSATNEIVAPRIYVYERPWTYPAGDRKNNESSLLTASARGVDGVKYFDLPSPADFEYIARTAHRLGLKVISHDRSELDALQLARGGLDTLEHFFGLPEALSNGQLRMTHGEVGSATDEQGRFRYYGTLWEQAYRTGADSWSKVADALIACGLTLVPTMSVYEACADVERVRTLEWHAEYALPALLQYWEPARSGPTGSFWYSWTSTDEASWRRSFSLWMSFLRLYHDRGGRIAAGADSGFWYDLFGFGYIRELELLEQAGLEPSAVIRCATLSACEALGVADQLGTVTTGKLADLVVVAGNPLDDLKVLYGTGAVRITEDGTATRTTGIRFVLKDGIVYDAADLLLDVRHQVAAAKEATGSPMTSR